MDELAKILDELANLERDVHGVNVRDGLKVSIHEDWKARLTYLRERLTRIIDALKETP